VQRSVPTVTTREQSEERATKADITHAEIAREKRPEPAGEVGEREIGGSAFKLGKALDQTAHNQIVEVIARNLDMPGIDPDFLCHRLTMDPKVRPVR